MDKFICKCHGSEFKDQKSLREHLYYIINKEKKLDYAKREYLINKDRHSKNNKKWRLVNKEKDLSYHSEYHSKPEVKENSRRYRGMPENKEKHKINCQKFLKKNKKYYSNYYKSNKKTMKAQVKEWHKNNPNYTKEYYQQNASEIIKKVKKYFKTPEGKISGKAARARRRVNIKLGGFSKLTKEKVQEVYERNIKKYSTLTCELCGKPIKFGEDALEHFIPISRYKDFPNKDLNALDNLGVAHNQFSKEACNGKKYNKTLEEWFKYV